MMARMSGKVAVITGGANGLGKASALRFTEEDAKGIVVADMLEDAGLETVSMIEKAGGKAIFVSLDAVNRLNNEEMIEAAITEFGSIDVLVTAAGITHQNYLSGDREAEVKMAIKRAQEIENPAQQFVDGSLEEWQKVLDVNLTGTYFAIQAAASAMIEQNRGGSIITLASIASKHPDAGPTPYVVSKAGVWMLTKKAARELSPANIRVNAIGPGFIETHMTTIFEIAPPERVEETLKSVPMGRRGLPIEIANTALFLASDESSYMTGEILHPDGGYFTD
jgi:NAD(P)-dependent dehydrogenase (short-subunit alcohol dehydrogenase family)